MTTQKNGIQNKLEQNTKDIIIYKSHINNQNEFISIKQRHTSFVNTSQKEMKSMEQQYTSHINTLQDELKKLQHLIQNHNCLDMLIHNMDNTRCHFMEGNIAKLRCFIDKLLTRNTSTTNSQHIVFPIINAKRNLVHCEVFDNTKIPSYDTM